MKRKENSHISTKSQYQNSRGQVSVFLIFLFQVLFVFFAMIINVGMLVYYKINLQNSVDLAAYYASMKQAEMLNTIGHVNYQIRQSWKLLVFRSTILGNLGPDQHPARPTGPGIDSFKPAPPEGPYLNSKGQDDGFPVFCITISDIFANTLGTDAANAAQIINTDDNQCRDDTQHKLSGFKIPDVIWTLPGYNEKIREASITLQDKFLTEFTSGGIRNFLTQAAFIIQFRADSLNRRKTIGILANSMSLRNEDFYDIEGNSVSGGALKVLEKNLAEQNRANPPSYSLYNSLADINCGGPNSDIEGLPGWLKEVEVYVQFPYADSIVTDIEGSDDKAVAQDYRRIGEEDIVSLPSAVLKVGVQNSDIYNSLSEMNKLVIISGQEKRTAGRWTTAIGVEKNPWCMPYIGFKAETTPKLPFMPARFTPKLVAKTFAKPFGGKIGPWYGKTWPNRSVNSFSESNNTEGSRIDGRLPPRYLPGLTAPPKLGTQTNEHRRFFPNFSRFPGDPFGLLSQSARWAYGKYFWKSRQAPRPPFWTSMWLGPFRDSYDKSRDDNSGFFMGPLSGDILADAYNNEYFKNVPDLAGVKKYAREMRLAEIAAISPDLFDISYYSIEPRFNEFLLPKLASFIANSTFNPKRPHLLVRGDLGWRSPSAPGDDFEIPRSFNVEMQVDQFKKHEYGSKTSDQIFQSIKEIDQILTSWSEKAIINYDPSLSNGKIGKCFSRLPANEEPWTPGSCVQGGRTGYSVKVVSKKFLLNSIPNIGGEGVSGTILNPPDSNF